MAENRLAGETSPYLRQHKDDPVDWYPFGPEAFSRAAELDRPLFFSIGYSACHWCHVMAHESFADRETAQVMNERFVAVKVDREERPDVDAVYMEAVQAATGHGGWPMSVFATPDGRPFFAGTYFPNRPGRGMPTFRAVLDAVSDAWTSRRGGVLSQADALSQAVARRLEPPRLSLTDHDGGREVGATTADLLDSAALDRAISECCRRLVDMADPVYGGFGRAPKFPQPLFLDLLLRSHREGLGPEPGQPASSAGALDVAVRALEAMAAGGIWDHLGGGFCRYSVDREWLVPHFEKMLYDEAQLARVYLHAWQITGDARWRQVLDEIVAYVLRDLALPGGGLASAEDADSEGEEGRFYLWGFDEIEEALGPELAPAAVSWWGVTRGGNFEGRNILHRPDRNEQLRPPEIDVARLRLFEVRALRVRPGLDDKALTEWNAMMCATLAEAALATGEAAWSAAALRLGEHLRTAARSRSGRVLRCPRRRDGSELLGYAADAAWTVEAFVRLAEMSGDFDWLNAAAEMAGQLTERFSDGEWGGLYTTGSDAPALLVRPRELYDNVTPSALSVAVGALARLAALLAPPRGQPYEDAARRLLASASDVVLGAPTAVPGLLAAADMLLTGLVEVAVTGDRPDLVGAVVRSWHPRAVIAWSGPPAVNPRSSGDWALLKGRDPGFAYVCRAGACRLPVATPSELRTELASALARSQRGQWGT